LWSIKAFPSSKKGFTMKKTVKVVHPQVESSF